MLAQETIRAIILLTVHAPSSHNTQPWRFRVDRDGIDLLADRTRSLPINDPMAWIKAGQVLQRALLLACQHGLQASYLNQPVEIPSLRVRLRELLDTDEHPQLLIRWRYPTEDLPPAVRRPVDSVLEVSGT